MGISGIRFRHGPAGARRHAVLAASIALPAVFCPAPTGAQECTAEIKEAPVLGADEPQKNVSIRWCNLAGAPSVEDPSLVGAPDAKSMAWRRHERASECIWIPQCRITLRSGGSISKEDYPTIPDLQADVGDEGDVILHTCDEGDAGNCADSDHFDFATELIPLWEQCAESWEDQEKGILAVSLGNFVDSNGNVSGYDGLALSGAISLPALAMVDPTLTAADNERVLAHEVGHLLDLCHTNDDCDQGPGGDPANLMRSNVPNGLLFEDQCTVARDFLDDNPQIDPPTDGLVLAAIDAARDERGEFPNQPGLGFLDLFRITGIDDIEAEGRLRFVLAVADTFGAGATGTYFLMFDVDNDPATGANSASLVETSDMDGVDLVIFSQVSESAGAGEVQVRRGADGAFEAVPGTGVEAILNQVVVNAVGENEPGVDTPLLAEIVFDIAASALPGLGFPPAGEALFPSGLRLQAAALAFEGDGGVFADLGPDVPVTLEFPELRFPVAEISGLPCAGETFTVDVSGLSAGKALKAFLGSVQIDPGVGTDAEGSATFQLAVPADFPPGPTLLSVGVTDPDDAVTADVIVDTCPGGTGQRLRHEYVAKMICGVQTDTRDTGLARGHYATTVNVRNRTDRDVRIRKELSLTRPPGGQEPGDVLRIGLDELAPRHAMATDCPDVTRRLFPGGLPGGVIEGFLVLQSTRPLDVIGVHTTATLSGDNTAHDHASIHVEPAPGRRLPLRDDAGEGKHRRRGGG